MSDVILKVENVSKLYRLGNVGTGTFGGDVQRFWKTKILGQEDPFLIIGQTNDRTSKDKADFVWALQDINFEVSRGEVLGIIGKNGAGKSTLLKLMSRITAPTKGTIKSAGRIASLLEVGTGFHPELTGRENIYLNGAILGMTKKEIQSRFDEIVDFSGCELYIDTPTKRYSSGMTVRLGFAVAAFLDPEILVIDEVLAVGDAEFQKKAIGKMQDVSKGSGRTILFVSHNMGSVKRLCDRGLLLENGKSVKIDSIQKIIDYYENTSNKITFKSNPNNRKGQGNVQFDKVESIKILSNSKLKVQLNLIAKFNISNVDIGLSLHNLSGDTICYNYSSWDNQYLTVKEGINNFSVNLSPLALSTGTYLLRGRILVNGLEEDYVLDPLEIFDIENSSFYDTGITPNSLNTSILVKSKWY